MNILILYSELAEYTLACVEELSMSPNANIHIVKWPIKTEAPFKFRTLNNVKFYNREDYQTSDLVRLAQELNPQIIITSGWMDKGYVQVCKAMFGKCKTVLTIDNHWKGDIKQRLKSFLAKHYFKTIFSTIWVPGKPQIPFAKKLGFNDHNIFTGFYSADLKLFKPNSTAIFNFNLLYVGRYLEFKGINELWHAFDEFKKTCKHPWKLHCVGTGELWEEKTEHDSIVHHGFLQPKELKAIVSECSVFVLPSHKEPWGVVVHEMAASGLALLCSEQIGAASSFLIEGKNGYSFQSNNTNSLLSSFKKLDALSKEELKNMGKESLSLAEKITPQKWVETLFNIASQ